MCRVWFVATVCCNCAPLGYIQTEQKLLQTLVKGKPLQPVLTTTRLSTMRAVQVDAPGGPGVLRVAAVSPPHLAPQEIRIRQKLNAKPVSNSILA